MKARLLKKLRQEASSAITMDYVYPLYKVIIYASGYQTNGIVGAYFRTLKEAELYMVFMRRSYIINTARLNRVGGRKLR